MTSRSRYKTTISIETDKVLCDFLLSLFRPFGLKNYKSHHKVSFVESHTILKLTFLLEKTTYQLSHGFFHTLLILRYRQHFSSHSSSTLIRFWYWFGFGFRFRNGNGNGKGNENGVCNWQIRLTKDAWQIRLTKDFKQDEILSIVWTFSCITHQVISKYEFQEKRVQPIYEGTPTLSQPWISRSQFGGNALI